MTEQTVIATLQEVINDGEAIERKLRQLIKQRRIDANALAIALTRIERFQFDVKIAIEELRQA